MNDLTWLVWAAVIFSTVMSILRFILYLEPWKNRQPKMPGTATLLRRSVVYHHGWRYYAVFSLGGLEMELETSESAYCALTDGHTCQLTWQGNRMCYFIPEKEGFS